MKIPDPRLLETAKDVYPDGRDDIAFVSYHAGENHQFGPMVREGDEWKLPAGKLPMTANTSMDELTAKCQKYSSYFRALQRDVRGGAYDSVKVVQELLIRDLLGR